MWHGKCVTHKALYSHFFLGFQRMPNFAFFKGSDDAEVSRKQIRSFPLKPSPLVSRKKTHFLIGFCSRNPDNPANPQRPQIFCSQNVAAKNTVFLVQIVPIIPEVACDPQIGEYVGIMKFSGFRTLDAYLKNGGC